MSVTANQRQVVLEAIDRVEVATVDFMAAVHTGTGDTLGTLVALAKAEASLALALPL